VTLDPAHGALALLLQACGLLPIAVLGFLLARAVRVEPVRWFGRAWACLTTGTFALYASSRLPATRFALEPLYYVGGYAFVLFLLAGLRCLSTGAPLRLRRWWLAPLAVLAVALSATHPLFTGRFVLHAALLSGALVLAWREARAIPAGPAGGWGAPLVRFSLLALAVWFFQYVPFLGFSALSSEALPAGYAAGGPLVELLLETLLGLALLTLVVERQQAALEVADLGLRGSREELSALVRLDPLTASLNRHAFYSMVEGKRSSDGATGCVAAVDVDSVRPINETFGHPAGDAAIRATASAIRQLVRADDLVFRWGGDEFLIVLFGVAEEEVRRRLGGLERLLTRVPVPGSAEPLSVSVSAGVAAFEDMKHLERAIETAEERMHRAGLAKRAAGPEVRS
jgi:diguanylate cyclase (GGDEF)-like protein